MLIKLYMRRAIACTQLGLFSDSLADYTTARDRILEFYAKEISSGSKIPIDVNLNDISADIEKLEKLVVAESFKKTADAFFSEKALDAAVAKYTEALCLVPVTYYQIIRIFSIFDSKH